MIKLVRIDDKLVHAQIALGWVPKLKPTCLIIANDDAAKDELRKKVLTSAAPDNVIVRILSLGQAVAELKCDGESQLMLVVSKPADVVFLMENGVSVRAVSLGWMSFMPGKRQIFKTVYVDDDDIRAFQNLIKSGVEVKYQASPSDAQSDITEQILEDYA